MELLPTKRMTPSLDSARNSMVMLKPNFRSSSGTAKERKLPYTPDRAIGGSGVGVGKGVGVSGVDVTGVTVTSLADIISVGVSSMVARVEPVTLEVEGTLDTIVGCADVDEISVVSANVVNVGVTSTEIKLDASAKPEVVATVEEGSGTTKVEVLMLDVDGEGV